MTKSVEQFLVKAHRAFDQGNYEQASRFFESVVSANPQAHAGWFGLGEIAFKVGQLDAALPFFEHASNLNPESVRYLHRLGEVCCRVGLVEEGLEVFQRASKKAGDNKDILCSLSGAYASLEKWAEAKKVLSRVVALPGAGAPHFCLRGLASQHLGELDDALEDFETATRIDSNYPDGWLSLGHLCLVKKLKERVGQCVSALTRLAPERKDVQEFLGDVELSRGNFKRAVGYLQQAIVQDPDSAVLQAKLGLGLVQGGDALAAVEAMERAHALGVSEDWILEHLGLLFTTGGQLDAARENLEMAVERRSDNLGAWNTLIVVYTKLGESEKARQAAETILAIDPNYVNALLNMGSWYADQARTEEALEYFEKALEVDANRPIAYTNTLWAMVHSSEINAAQILERARAFDLNLCAQHRREDNFADRDRSPGRRLRIGWVTSDMREHPVAAFVVPFLAKLNRDVVETVIYFNAVFVDTVTGMAKAGADKWRDVFALGDDELADLIRSDDIDILIDLNGNTEGNRLLSIARKPAPIAVTWLGFPGTSGMSAIDYILIPPDDVLQEGKWCSEIPWPLPDCYGVRTMIPNVAIKPGLPCEREGRSFTFACLNNFRKASREVVRLWSQILIQTPGSRLILVARGGRDGVLVAYIQEQFAQYGIGPERLDIRGVLPMVQYFDMYNEVDLCLDPFPFNGGTTGYDSIWMGVPFVTFPGETLVARMGKAILENVGLAELVVDSSEAYVALALQLAQDKGRLKALRSDLRERMQTSPLMDADRFARGLENAFRGMWHEWCKEA